MKKNEKIDLWEQYSINLIEIPKRYYDYEEKIKNILIFPHLPNKLKNALKDYLDIINKKIELIGSELSKYARTLPKIYPNSYPISLFSSSIKIDYNIHPLENGAKIIYNYFTDYYSNIYKDIKSYIN